MRDRYVLKENHPLYGNKGRNIPPVVYECIPEEHKNLFESANRTYKIRGNPVPTMEGTMTYTPQEMTPQEMADAFEELGMIVNGDEWVGLELDIEDDSLH